jgi:hypothetical protein
MPPLAVVPVDPWTVWPEPAAMLPMPEQSPGPARDQISTQQVDEAPTAAQPAVGEPAVAEPALAPLDVPESTPQPIAETSADATPLAGLGVGFGLAAVALIAMTRVRRKRQRTKGGR